ncbi:MAG: hypothetical protein DWQ04_33565 [Chloroflexi bacterium]|nr:MAG: hypothetical protein DWQ04_33565 [Chloroflexota bacterium]
MFRKRFVGGLLALLLVFGGLSFMGRTSYSRGWTDGYFSAQQAESSEDGAAETAVPPHSRFRAPYYRGYSPFAMIIGGIFKFWLFMMLFGFIFKMLFFRRWRRGHWGKQGHHFRGRGPWGSPPWCYGHDSDDEPYEKSPEDVEPDIRSA